MLRRPAVRVSSARTWAPAVLAAICLVGFGLRFWAFARIPSDPFYDAAVRSMGLSWHNFFYGAFEPGGAVAVDKPPVDLWLQTAATKLFGFSSASLRLPQATAGTLAVPLLYDLVRRGFGHTAALASAAALAVLPVAVLTSRSDTMDTILSTMLLAGAWVIVAARPERRARAVIGAGAIAGLAFEVKVFQVAVGLPALGVLAWHALEGPAAQRWRTLARGGLAFAAVAAAWPLAASLAPGGHPWPIGSTNGTIWNVILVFNGLERLAVGSATSALPTPAPWRLFMPGLLKPIGFELFAALLLGGLAAHRAWRRGAPRDAAERLRWAMGMAIGVWLLAGFVLFSAQGFLRVRYLDAFSPAVAAALGIGLTAVVGTTLRRRAMSAATVVTLTAVLLAGMLAWPLITSLEMVRTGAYDSQTLGSMPAAQVNSLRRYLGAHQSAVRYELASSRATIAAPLIVRDARPVLMLTTWRGRPLVSAADLVAKVRAGQVRHLLLDERGCSSKDAPSCTPAVRWALAHSTDVSAAAGLGPGRILVRLDGGLG